MILVDSSVWIDFLSSRRNAAGDAIADLLESEAPIAVAGLVVMEVLQGLRREQPKVVKLLTECELLPAPGLETFIEAARLVHEARARGVTIGTVDAVLAAIALAHGAELFTLDRDFSRLEFAGLRLYRPISNRG